MSVAAAIGVAMDMVSMPVQNHTRGAHGVTVATLLRHVDERELGRGTQTFQNRLRGRGRLRPSEPKRTAILATRHSGYTEVAELASDIPGQTQSSRSCSRGGGRGLSLLLGQPQLHRALNR